MASLGMGTLAAVVNALQSAGYAGPDLWHDECARILGHDVLAVSLLSETDAQAVLDYLAAEARS
jgi:hypothetical protein